MSVCPARKRKPEYFVCLLQVESFESVQQRKNYAPFKFCAKIWSAPVTRKHCIDEFDFFLLQGTNQSWNISSKNSRISWTDCPTAAPLPSIWPPFTATWRWCACFVQPGPTSKPWTRTASPPRSGHSSRATKQWEIFSRVWVIGWPGRNFWTKFGPNTDRWDVSRCESWAMREWGRRVSSRASRTLSLEISYGGAVHFSGIVPFSSLASSVKNFHIKIWIE